MTLITVLISLVLERFLAHAEHWREPGWFERMAATVQRRWLGASLWDGAPGVVLLIVPVVLGVLVLQALLGAVLFGLPGFVFNVLVLLYCLGPRALDPQVEALTMALESGDEETARREAGELLGEEPPAGAALSRTVTDALLVRANERLFGVLFWFVLLGAVGAALYRAAWVLKERSAREGHLAAGTAEAARRLQWILDWIPSRLLAGTYALTGSFDDALAGWRAYHDRWRERFPDSNLGLLVATGNGALRLEIEESAAAAEAELGTDPIHSAMGLIWRSLIVWLTVLALVTLAGWVT